MPDARDRADLIAFRNRFALPLDDGLRRVNAPAGAVAAPAGSAADLVIKLFRLWQKGGGPGHPDAWLDPALPSWTRLPVAVPIARQSVLWPWRHQDPAGRLLAATAHCEGVEVWHTDTVLKALTGFPNRCFENVRGWIPQLAACPP